MVACSVDDNYNDARYHSPIIRQDTSLDAQPVDSIPLAMPYPPGLTMPERIHATLLMAYMETYPTTSTLLCALQDKRDHYGQKMRNADPAWP